MHSKRQTLLVILLALTLVCAFRLASTKTASAQGEGGLYFNELIQQSLKEKKGLTFFIKGQTIGGAVTKVLGPDAVEVRNQTYSRIVIRLNEVDAVAIN